MIFYNIRQISGKSLIFLFPVTFPVFSTKPCDIIPLSAAKAANNITRELFSMSNTIKKVAKQNGVSVKEVRKDLEEMIKVVMS